MKYVNLTRDELIELVYDLSDKNSDLIFENKSLKDKSSKLDLLVSDILNSLKENEKIIEENKRFNLTSDIDTNEQLINLKKYILKYLKDNKVYLD